MIPEEMSAQLAEVAGKPCWHVGAGGRVGSSFSLALGGKVERDRPLRHAPETDEAKRYQGEFRFLVWCSWRLGNSGAAIASSDQEPDNIAAALEVLRGNVLVEAVAQPPAWDLCLRFRDGCLLSVFCDHLRGDASIEQNWELWHGSRALLVGPGYEWRLHDESPNGSRR